MDAIGAENKTDLGTEKTKQNIMAEIGWTPHRESGTSFETRLSCLVREVNLGGFTDGIVEQ